MDLGLLWLQAASTLHSEVVKIRKVFRHCHVDESLLEDEALSC